MFICTYSGALWHNQLRNWSKSNAYTCPTQEFDMLEFFAGRGNLSRYMKLSGYRTGSLDILYIANGQAGKKRKSNPMNLLSVSGFAHLGL
jgi:hypothetical protein